MLINLIMNGTSLPLLRAEINFIYVLDPSDKNYMHAAKLKKEANNGKV